MIGMIKELRLAGMKITDISELMGMPAQEVAETLEKLGLPVDEGFTAVPDEVMTGNAGSGGIDGNR